MTAILVAQSCLSSSEQQTNMTIDHQSQPLHPSSPKRIPTIQHQSGSHQRNIVVEADGPDIFEDLVREARDHWRVRAAFICLVEENTHGEASREATLRIVALSTDFEHGSLPPCESLCWAALRRPPRRGPFVVKDAVQGETFRQLHNASSSSSENRDSTNIRFFAAQGLPTHSPVRGCLVLLDDQEHRAFQKFELQKLEEMAQEVVFHMIERPDYLDTPVRKRPLGLRSLPLSPSATTVTTTSFSSSSSSFACVASPQQYPPDAAGVVVDDDDHEEHNTAIFLVDDDLSLQRQDNPQRPTRATQPCIVGWTDSLVESDASLEEEADQREQWC